MKRHNSEGPGSEFKRPRGDAYNEALKEGKFELRFLVPTKCAGAVIGRGGETIKAIRQQYDALLSVPDRNTPERVFTMVVSRDRVAECFAAVLDRLYERLLELQTNKKNDDQIELKMLIHQSHAGAVIGRGGSKIKELREQTGAHLKVFKECCPLSTDRTLQITATKAKLPDVLKVVVDFVSEIDLKGSQKPYDAANYNPSIEYGCYLGDKPFVPPPIPQQGYGNAGGQSSVWSTGPNRMYGPPGGGGGMPSIYMDSSTITTQVTIPTELAGSIIGKAGERINRIRQESGARIDIGTPIGNERIITIVGTQHQIQTAQYLLQHSVRASESGRRYLQNQEHHRHI